MTVFTSDVDLPDFFAAGRLGRLEEYGFQGRRLGDMRNRGLGSSSPNNSIFFLVMLHLSFGSKGSRSFSFLSHLLSPKQILRATCS